MKVSGSDLAWDYGMPPREERSPLHSRRGTSAGDEAKRKQPRSTLCEPSEVHVTVYHDDLPREESPPGKRFSRMNVPPPYEPSPEDNTPHVAPMSGYYGEVRRVNPLYLADTDDE